MKLMPVSDIAKLVNESIALRAPNQAKIEEYAEKMANGVKFPSIKIGTWPKSEKYGETGIIDGLNRLGAAAKANLLEMPVEVVTFKTLAEAMLYGYTENMAHGIQVTDSQRNKRILLLRQLDPAMNIDRLGKVFGLHRSSIDRILKGDQGEGKSGPKAGASKSTAHANKDPKKAGALYKIIVGLNTEFTRKRPDQALELSTYLSPITEEYPDGEVDKERVSEVVALREHLDRVLKRLK